MKQWWKEELSISRRHRSSEPHHIDGQPNQTSLGPVSVPIAAATSPDVVDFQDTSLLDDRQLYPEERDILSTAQGSTESQGKSPQISAIIDEAIQTTEEEYKEYQHGGIENHWSIEPDIESRSAKLRNFNGHIDPVWSVAISLDGQRAASGSEDETIKIWDVETGSELRILKGHSHSVWSVAFSLDSKMIVSGSSDNTIKVWDTDTGSELQTLEGHSLPVWSVSFSPDGKMIVSGSGDNTIKLWDAETGSVLQTLNSHSGSVQSVAFSPNGQRIVSGSDDNTIKLWDVETGSELRTLKGHSNPVESVAFSPDGQRIVSGSEDCTIKLWDARTGSELQTIEGHSEWVRSVAFLPDSQTIVSRYDDDTIKLWDVQISTDLPTPKDHSNLVSYVSSGNALTSLERESRISFKTSWVCSRGERVLRLPPELHGPECLEIRNNTLVLGYQNGRVFFIRFCIPSD